MLHTIQDFVVNELGRADKLDVSSVVDIGHSMSVFLLIFSLLLVPELLLYVFENIVGLIAYQLGIVIVIGLGRVQSVVH